MPASDLPDSDHVIRHVKGPLLRENNKIDGSAFRLRQSEAGLSVHWLEYFADLPTSQQLDRVRTTIRLNLKRDGRFAQLSVGKTKKHLRTQLNDVRFLHKPLIATQAHPEDPAHSEILGLPTYVPDNGSSERSRYVLLGDMIAECVEAIHPARGE